MSDHDEPTGDAASDAVSAAEPAPAERSTAAADPAVRRRDAADILADAIGDLVDDEADEGEAIPPRSSAPSASTRARMARAADGDADDQLPGPVLTAAARARPMVFMDPEMWEDWWLRASLLVVFVLLYFVGLGSFGLWDPWEVHYGAVGWGLIERHDWISPWWGSYWEAPGKRMEGEYFFSKPILLLWMMGIGMQVFGFTELGIRFGVAVIATLGVMSAYLCGAKVFSRRVGVLMAVALGTSPFYAMLGRQAQTDMPFVGLMTVALCFFMMGVFGSDRNRKADKFSWWVFSLFLAAVVVPQLHTITVGQMTWRSNLHPVEAFVCYGPTQLGLYLLLIGAFVVTQVRQRNTSRGQLYLYVFYAFVALATMGKGILGFALPGAIIFVYLLVSREWGLLRRVELFRGIMLTVVVGFPWYGAVMARHGGIGGAWWNRFIIHDHFKRLATGVHQIDTGSFEHFIKWLAYGLFPWGSFVPAIIARALNGQAGSNRSDADRARTFLFIWFAVAFALFTMSSTKFHHYIFPAVPALALLAALVIDDLIEGTIEMSTWWPMFLAAAGLFALVGFDLVADPQHLKNMFTYKYDRQWDTDAWNPGFQAALRAFVAVGAVGLLFLANSGRRRLVTIGVIVLALNSFALTGWALNTYMSTISSTWSQGPLWATYYERCTRGEAPPQAHEMKRERYCIDSAISYKLNWRGETYYTMNEVIPIRDDDEWNYFIEQNDGRCFYAIMERARVGSFRSALPAAQRPTVFEEHGDNLKFVLMSANCREPEPERPAEPDAEHGETFDEAPE